VNSHLVRRRQICAQIGSCTHWGARYDEAAWTALHLVVSRLVEAPKPALAPREAATKNGHGNVAATGSETASEAAE